MIRGFSYKVLSTTCFYSFSDAKFISWKGENICVVNYKKTILSDKLLFSFYHEMHNNDH